MKIDLKIMNSESENCQSGNCGCEPSVVEVDRRRFMVSAGAIAAGLSAGPLLAAGSSESYATLLKSDPSLRG